MTDFLILSKYYGHIELFAGNILQIKLQITSLFKNESIITRIENINKRKKELTKSIALIKTTKHEIKRLSI